MRIRERKRKNKSGVGDRKTRYLFLLPAVVIYLAIIVIPAFYSLYISFFKWNGIGKMKFVGLKNYSNLFTNDPVFLTSLKNNFIWIILTVCITLVLALLFALLINKKFHGRTILRSVLYFPYILSGVVVGIIWRWIYDPNLGLVNSVVEMFNRPEWSYAWLSDPKWALIAVFIAACWMYVGGPMILFLAGLQTIPKDIQEAAVIDGASKMQAFFRVTLPMLSETTVIVLATQVVNSMKVYDIIYTMTAGGPANSTNTLALYMVKQSFTFAKMGTGAAISMVMVVIMMTIIIPYVSYSAKH